MDDGSGSLWAITLVVKLLIISVCAYLSAVFSGSEVAILSLNRIRLLELSEKGDKRAKILLKILETPHDIVSSLLVSNITVNIVMVVLWTSILLDIKDFPIFAQNLRIQSLNWNVPTDAFIVAGGGLLLTIFIIIMCEIFPKNLFHMNAEIEALRRAGFLRMDILIVKPLVWILYKISSILLKLVGISLSNTVSPITEEEIIDLIETGEEEGLIQEHEREMIHSIFEFGDLKVKDIMIPRVDMHALSVKSTIKEALDKIVKTGHSRLPVYGDTRDDIIGLLYAKDLLGKFNQKDFEKLTLDKLYRDVEFVPEEMPLSNLFKGMKRKKIHFAIVVDEYGGTAGIVSIEDVLEELVGEIEDEFDKTKLLYRNQGDMWVVDGKMNLHDLEDLTEVELPSNGADTVGGVIYQKLGRIPSEGDEIKLGSLIFKVKTLKNQRIKEIEIRKVSLTYEEEIYDEVGE